MNLPNKIIRQLAASQENEITEYHIYKRLAGKIKRQHNKQVINSIAEDELRHYNVFKEYTKTEIEPNRFKLWKYYWISRIFGLTFGVKLMERGEETARVNYEKLRKYVPAIKKIISEEDEHEHELLDMLDEERLKYVGSIVLGLNDALVELTGALAGLTLALQKSNLVAVAGLVTGIAASFSMAASEYLSTKSEKSEKHPLKSAIYTGSAYILTVFFLIFPYLILDSLYLSLAWTLANAIIVILIFTYYISIAKDYSFRKRFWEMAFISLGVAALSFGIGYLIRILFGIDV
ncbi:rubrerythrin family protein [Candidatus Woesearchaeota archaeon]|nr:rubrerythrin family protein [Candidatus Woesearchaeota archaeon]